MPRSFARASSLTACLALGLACSPPAEDPIARHSESSTPTAVSADARLLLTIMVDLGRDMNRLSDALWRDDLEGTASAAEAIADHPHVSAIELQRVRASLGDRFAAFVEGDKRVHDSALRLAEHAAAGDMSAVLQELGELQSGCIACHDAFRAELRTSRP